MKIADDRGDAPLRLPRRERVRGWQFLLAGCVQGLGVRPAIARLALELQLSGHAVNTPRGVEVLVVGTAGGLRAFRRRLAGGLPPAARGASVHTTGCVWPPTSAAPRSFVILESSADEPPATAVPRDRGICRRCAAEATAPGDSRQGYGLVSCADCGPRYTIVERLPYERGQTAMRHFPLCRDCALEYADPGNRRFRAEAIACPRCGPRVECVDPRGRVLGRDAHAVTLAARALRAGQIVALCGVGGYQLLVDAQDAAAVERLRQRKGRPAKPLAVMVDTLAEARRLAQLGAAEVAALADAANPIVILRRRGDAPLAPGVAGPLASVGLLLPSSELHRQLLRQSARPLVCTSGNREGEPLEYQPVEARRALAGMADLFVEHSRPVLRPIDDSVVRVIAGEVVVLRAGRGLAPVPLALPAAAHLLAVGGQAKGALALANGAQAVLGAHLGDLDGQAARQRYDQQAASLIALYGAAPRACAVDCHPDYFSTRWGEDSGWPLLAVQHHHAHAAAALVAAGWHDREALALVWDGSGWGDDQTLWGGELLVASTGCCERLGHLLAFPLPGGERAIREPWRTAAAMLERACGEEAARGWPFSREVRRRVDPLLAVCRAPRLAGATSSMGRLFDAVAALVLGIEHAAYEAEPALRLEDACHEDEPGTYPFPVADGGRGAWDWRPLVEAVAADVRSRQPAGRVAMRFHRALADAAWRACRRQRGRPVVLGGGVMQNRVLVELLAERFDQAGLEWALPTTIPPGDGGLAAGQLAVALARVRAEERSPCV